MNITLKKLEGEPNLLLIKLCKSAAVREQNFDKVFQQKSTTTKSPKF